jgi:hypothetical protein
LGSERIGICCRRIVRRKDQKDFCDADTDADAKAPEAFRGKKKPDAVSCCVSEKEKIIADSGAGHDSQTEVKIKEKESFADCESNRNAFSVCDARGNTFPKSDSNSDRDTDTVSVCVAQGKEGYAQRHDFA